jgi:hypothetical protein
MSWGTCYSGSNNIHFNFPPMMSDGRIHSSWQPDSVINERIQQQNNITSNWSYRQYLTQNASTIMQMNTQQACNDLGMNPHIMTNATPSANVPLLYKNTFDTSAPGYGYCTSDLKNPYLSREQLNARLVSPSYVINQQ